MPMLPDNPSVMDPLAAQAASLLARAMVATRDRQALWSAFRVLVAEHLQRLEEGPAREALDELERRGVNLELLARLAEERHRASAGLSGAPPTRPGPPAPATD